MNEPFHRPRLGVQGPVVGFPDPWAGPVSDAIMRTGTGKAIDSQDPAPTPEAFLGLLTELGADFYVHHVLPGLEGQDRMVADTAAAGVDVVLGNEYGNINGPHSRGTNRYDVPLDAAQSAGNLIGLLYDEPEHLQINAGQYRGDEWLPHFADTAGLDARAAEASVAAGLERVVRGYADGLDRPVPVLTEHVFPVMFHTFARAGATPCPKVMKEAFQPLQLATALGAALQYGRDLWICADLWGPDIGPWFTRAPGLPGHSPEEFASALRMAYLFGPTHLFVENVDALARSTGDGFERTEFGEVLVEFTRDFVPANPLPWTFGDARPRTVLIHAEDSDFGTGRRPFGDPDGRAPERSRSVFDAWHALSHGSIPTLGSCMHAPGFGAPPRARLERTPRDRFPLASGADRATGAHPLFHPLRDMVVFDERVDGAVLGEPELIVVAGTRLPRRTRDLVRSCAERGAVVVIARHLTDDAHGENERIGEGRWIVTDDFADPDAAEALRPHLGARYEWTQRFGDRELVIAPADEQGTTLRFATRPA